ncbi:MAG: alpha/beta fold hydrolase [Pseudomonadota bacterium]
MTETIALNSVLFGEDFLGASPPIIILHGLFGSARNWQTMAQKLAQERSVFALDLRNHGDSPHTSSMSYPEMAADVIQFLDAHQIDSANLIGHSMGGKTAMDLALDWPDRIATLIIVDIAPIVYQHNYDELLANLHDLDLTAIKRRADANRLLGQVLDDDELRLFLLQNLIVKPGEPTRWRINLEAIERNVNHLVQYTPEGNNKQFSGPAHLIRGGLSDYVSEDYYPALTRLFPNLEIHVIDEAGHWPHAQKPQDFLETTQKILR